MDFDDAPQEAAFRAECRSWLAANARLKERPDQAWDRGLARDERVRRARAWQRRKAEAGFGAITWPQALGGRGGTPIEELIWRQEEARFDVPTMVFAVSLGMVLPAVAAHASEALRARHIAPALRGDEVWCMLLSEPGAGSDLGMVRTRAERTSGADGQPGWRLNGQKVWTSLAQYCEYGLVLARTDPKRSKFEGLTSFQVDMKAPGIEVRPIRQPDGEAEFNEVFFHDVFVPDTQRIGAEHGGWKVTLSGLMSERMSIGGNMPPELERTALEMARAARFGGKPALADGRIRERLADLHLAVHGLWLMQCRALTALGKGREPGPEMSVGKVIAARTLQEFAHLAMDLQGTHGVLTAHERGEDWQLIDALWFGAAGMRIAGGTDEIVKNSIGERVLGLPGEPRTDKGVAFEDLPK